MAVKTKDVRDEILRHLKTIERNLAWLSRKVDINYNTMYSIFVQKTVSLSDENKDSINKVLGTDY